jgi:hypothetical protein
VVAGFVAAAQAAPEELSTIANVMAAPPLPFIPAAQHGKLVGMGMLCSAGEAEAGQRALAPFRVPATPLAELVRPMPTRACTRQRRRACTRPRWSTRCSWTGSTATPPGRSWSTWRPPTLRVAQLRVLGGRWPGCPPRRPRSPTAARRSGHRRLPLPGPADKPGRQAWLEEFAAALGQGDDGASTGFLGEDGPAPISQAYPESTWDRLVEVKARYDPTNLFRHNHNLPAAG